MRFIWSPMRTAGKSPFRSTSFVTVRCGKTSTTLLTLEQRKDEPREPFAFVEKRLVDQSKLRG